MDKEGNGAWKSCVCGSRKDGYAKCVIPFVIPDEDNVRRKLRREVIKSLWKGEKEDALKRLKKLQSQLLSEGKQDLLEGQEGLTKLIGYMENNWEGIINYQKMQKEGYLIASSLVENAADLVVAKRQKKKRGMHWSHKGSDRLCALRALWLNEEWEEYWEQRVKKAA